MGEREEKKLDHKYQHRLSLTPSKNQENRYLLLHNRTKEMYTCPEMYHAPPIWFKNLLDINLISIHSRN